MGVENEVVEQKLKDIQNIDFGESLEEISSSLMIVMTLFEIDDNPKILKACKLKLFEGIALLKKLGNEEKAEEIQKKLDNIN